MEINIFAFIDINKSMFFYQAGLSILENSYGSFYLIRNESHCHFMNEQPNYFRVALEKFIGEKSLYTIEDIFLYHFLIYDPMGMP